MAMVFNIGTMEPITRASGAITKLRVKELFGTLKATFTMASLETTWQTDMESTPILTAQNTKENSKTMFKKVMEKRSGSTVPNTLDHT